MNTETDKIVIRPVHFLSYSSLNTKNSCPRNFQLDKEGASDLRESNVTFAFGHAVGAGVQSLLCGGSETEAIWEAFKFWDVGLFEEDKKKQKSIAWAVNAIRKFVPYARSILRDYEVVSFDGRPAKELSFRISGIPGGFYYRAHIDVVLEHRETGQLLVVELKTTGLNNVLEATYGNSEQALSYSIVLDKIAEGNNSYLVWYIVYKTEEEDFEFLPFSKSMLAKARWIKTLLLDAKHIGDYINENFFPMRGQSCVQFFRTCKYYGTCDMSDRALLASETELKKRVEAELEDKYTFEFTLQEIIDQQLA